MNLKEIRSVLLVDDDVAVVQMLSGYLERKGLNIFTAESGEAAIKILNFFQIDLVISDYEMENGDGAYLLSHVNTLEVRPLFYFFSGKGEEIKKIKEKLYYNDAFTKPFELNNILSIFDSISVADD